MVHQGWLVLFLYKISLRKLPNTSTTSNKHVERKTTTTTTTAKKKHTNQRTPTCKLLVVTYKCSSKKNQTRAIIYIFPDSRPSQHQDHKKTILLSQTLHNCFLFIKDQSKKIEISKVFNFSFIHSLPVYPKQISFSNCINICKLEGDEKQERFKCGDVVCLKRQILN